MQLPPPELAWIGIFASLFATITSVLNVYLFWRNRGRLLFRVILAERYFEHWKEYEIENAIWPGSSVGIKEGDIKRALYIIEVEITNKYPVESTIGRIRLGDWMYSKEFIPGMYPLKHDYRVFDIYTRERTSLDEMVKLKPNGSHGLRIEIFEDTDGPHWKSNHSRYAITMPSEYKIEFLANGKLHKHKIKFARLKKQLAYYLYNRNYDSLKQIDRWSEDLFEPVEHNALSGQLPPPGVRLPLREYKYPLRVRLRNFSSQLLTWLVYGTKY